MHPDLWRDYRCPLLKHCAWTELDSYLVSVPHPCTLRDNACSFSEVDTMWQDRFLGLEADHWVLGYRDDPGGDAA